MPPLAQNLVQQQQQQYKEWQQQQYKEQEQQQQELKLVRMPLVIPVGTLQYGLNSGRQW
jgi:hypothetical protein